MICYKRILYFTESDGTILIVILNQHWQQL